MLLIGYVPYNSVGVGYDATADKNPSSSAINSPFIPKMVVATPTHTYNIIPWGKLLMAVQYCQNNNSQEAIFG